MFSWSNKKDTSIFSDEKSALYVAMTYQFLFQGDRSSRGVSNEYPQRIFLWRNKKNINNFRLKKAPYLELLCIWGTQIGKQSKFIHRFKMQWELTCIIRKNIHFHVE